MKYLLDTHILLWWLDMESPMSDDIREIIDDGHNNIYASAASVWEIAIKKNLGKLDVPDNLLAVLKKTGIDLIPITAEHATSAGALPLLHNDPFDRMLIAQAIVEGMTIITHDKAFRGYHVPCVTA